MASLINKSAIRDLIFGRLEVVRPALVGKMTQVNSATYNCLEARIRVLVDRELESMQTVGKTIKLFQT